MTVAILLSLIIGFTVATILFGWLSFELDSDLLFGVALVLFMITIIGGVALTVETVNAEYEKRIETKYNIEVTRNIDDDSEGVIVYNNGDCFALKEPNDVLKAIGCFNTGEELPTSGD